MQAPEGTRELPQPTIRGILDELWERIEPIISCRPRAVLGRA